MTASLSSNLLPRASRIQLQLAVFINRHHLIIYAHCFVLCPSFCTTHTAGLSAPTLFWLLYRASSRTPSSTTHCPLYNSTSFAPIVNNNNTMSSSTTPRAGSSGVKRSTSGNRRPISRPTTPLRPSSRSSLRESGKASVGGASDAPLEAFEPAFAELSDSMADLEANFMHLQLMHESLSRFSENFASFLYGLNMNAFCVDFPEVCLFCMGQWGGGRLMGFIGSYFRIVSQGQR